MVISAHLYATHHDESLYPHADEFDGFRFVEAEPSAENSEEQKGISAKKTMYTTSPAYLAFGHGKNAWWALLSNPSAPILPDAENTLHSPGRFFGAMGVKLTFAYIIANYDIKWPDSVYRESVPGYTTEGYRPPDLCYGHRMMPDHTPKMLIRKRVGAGGERGEPS
jgi:hypothetical protein